MKIPTLASEIKVTLTIFVSSVCWIFFSDKLLYEILGDKSNSSIEIGAILKGLLFVTVMSLGLFYLLKKHDKKMSEALARYMGLFINNPNSLWIYDEKTLDFMDVNDSTVNKYGYSKDEFLAMTIRDITIDDEMPFVDKLKSHITLSDSGIWKHKTKKGDILFVRLLSHSIEYNGRKCVFVLADDITTILTQSAKLKTIAFKNSHEVRKPVANILGLISLIDKEILDKETAELFSYIQQSAKELDNVIKEIATESFES